MTSRIEIGGVFNLRWVPELFEILTDCGTCFWNPDKRHCRGALVAHVYPVVEYLFQARSAGRAACFAFSSEDGWIDNYVVQHSTNVMAEIGMTARLCISSGSHPDNLNSYRCLVRRTLPLVTKFECDNECETVMTQNHELRDWLNSRTLEAQVRKRLNDAQWVPPRLRIR